MRQDLVSRFVIFVVLSLVRTAAAETAPAADASTPVAWGVEGTPPRSVALRLTISPEWAYRTFLQKEPISPDKRYVASGMLRQSVRFEIYPLAFPSPAIEGAKDIGFTANYSRVLALISRDIDTENDVAGQWYQFGFGLRYRMLGGEGPLALGLTIGIQRSVFDFDTTPSSRPVAIGRYTLLPVGADIRYAWRRFSIFADGRFLVPLTVSPPGNRTPSGARLGGHLAGGGIVRFGRYFELEARADYTLMYLSLPGVEGRDEGDATVLDQYLVFSVGPTLLLY
ncbi:MAG TPA: hypothetical protein VK550_10035 [Polyangiaceae bacterium]|jgi:hypothetical protein|nr:hypothetical protein [Polyangiaceae bacterium]